MTLAVAIPFPWPEYEARLPGYIKGAIAAIPGMEIPRAVIMAADSRWTYRTGIDYDDGGVKIVALGSAAAGMYAGNTRAGQLALGRLGDAIRKGEAGKLRRPTDPEGILRAVWKQNRHFGGGLQVCFAFFDANGDSHVFRFDSVDDFKPVECEGIVTLGWSEECEFFRRRLGEEVNKRLSEEYLRANAISLSYEEWAIISAVMIREAGEISASATVGGPPLIAVLTANGVEGRSIHAADTSEPRPEFKRLTLAEEQVSRFYERQKKRGSPFVHKPRRRASSTRNN